MAGSSWENGEPVRRRYPWKLGATSFVLPAPVEENVQYLAGRVDDVQLLFFESSWQARLPYTIDMDVLSGFLGEHSYTVHLPLDLQLGAEDTSYRLKCVDEICRIVAACESLHPVAFDLHLNREKNINEITWQTNCRDSLLVLQGRLGATWAKLCIENIDYDFGFIAKVVAECGAKVCVDFGHLHHFGFNDGDSFAKYDVQHIHLHGVVDGRDHQPLKSSDIPFLQRLGQDMVDNDYGGVVTLELYKAEWLAESLDVLERAWADFGLKD